MDGHIGVGLEDLSHENSLADAAGYIFLPGCPSPYFRERYFLSSRSPKWLLATDFDFVQFWPVLAGDE